MNSCSVDALASRRNDQRDGQAANGMPSEEQDVIAVHQDFDLVLAKTGAHEFVAYVPDERGGRRR
jgi:hypothetical protein